MSRRLEDLVAVRILSSRERRRQAEDLRVIGAVYLACVGVVTLTAAYATLHGGVGGWIVLLLVYFTAGGVVATTAARRMVWWTMHATIDAVSRLKTSLLWAWLIAVPRFLLKQLWATL